MEAKVLLYDSNNVKIGETFARRARQLVKQQRASWVDDNQNAIRFAPGMENTDTAHDEAHEEELTQTTQDTDKKLLQLAKQRVYARLAFKLHLSIALLISSLLIIIFMLTSRPGNYFWPVWPTFGLGLSVVIHGIIYKFTSEFNMADKISHEYEQLKHRCSYGNIE